MTTAPASPVNMPVPAPVEPTTEYVAGGALRAYGQLVRSLPWHIDDITRDLGDDVYDRMLVDPQVLSCINIFKAGVLGDGLHLSAAIEQEDAPDYARAQELLTFCEDVLAALTTPLDAVLWDILDAIVYGNKVAEQVYALRDGQLVLTALKVKPRRSIAFVVDAYLNVLGMTAVMPGSYAPVQVGSIGGDILPPNLLPRSKFAILTFRPKDSDPRGTSILRAAYNAWWLKMQTWPELLKFLAQFAGAAIIGITSPDDRGGFDLDGDGQPIPGTWKSGEERMLDALMEFRNGAALALANGSQAIPVSSTNGGTAFERAISLFDKQIMIAILHQTLASGEGEHASRAQAGIHQDTLGLILRQAKHAVTGMFVRDILQPLVRYNFGDAALALTPKASLGEVEQQDMTAMLTAVAQLERAGWFEDDQRPAVDVKLGLPQRKQVTRDPKPTNPPTNPPTNAPANDTGKDDQGDDDASV